MHRPTLLTIRDVCATNQNQSVLDRRRPTRYHNLNNVIRNIQNVHRTKFAPINRRKVHLSANVLRMRFDFKMAHVDVSVLRLIIYANYEIYLSEIELQFLFAVFSACETAHDCDKNALCSNAFDTFRW